MIAAQQYYIEYGTDMSGERLLNLLPNYIPDYCLTGDKPVEYWHQLITQAFRKVSLCDLRTLIDDLDIVLCRVTTLKNTCPL